MTETATTDFTLIEQSFDHIRRAAPALRKEKVSRRVERLKSLRQWIHANRAAIHQAMYNDFRKPSVEVDVIEVLHVLSEISMAMTNLDNWSRPKKVDASLTMLGTRSHIRYEPRGACLILSPWNYPLGLALGPLVSALAAGNTAILKPSEMTPHVSALIRRMAEEVFDKNIVQVVEGGPDVASFLTSLPFDHIFFTGSPSVGKLVMKAAAENLTSVTLELGGKSPSVITRSANIAEAAERTAVAKFVNNGQTCVAPDYVLVDETVKDDFLEHLIKELRQHFSLNGDFSASASYCRIVNRRNYDRLQELVQDAQAYGAKVLVDGEHDPATLFFHPVVLTDVHPDSRLLQEEIFGPVLPVISYKNLDDALALINAKPKALALYVFSRDRKTVERVLTETSSGGVCVNESGIHFLHPHLPFGGVNSSGIGKSHGHYGFLAFSNEKPVLRQKSGITTVRPFYPPYGERSRKLVDWFLRLF